ncbi:MAG TPA: GNAT family protein [Thermodesulfobacteriota bacterium]|nr:GNAT family protein [Thermodesulfobacteriota bacterium]
MRIGPGDEAKAAAVLLHPAVRNRLFDDSPVPTPDEIGKVLADPDVFVLMPAEGALLIATPFLYSTFAVHQAAIPGIRGAAVVQAGRLAVRWMFDNVSGCRKLVGFTPSWNVPAIAAARRVGFSIEGCIAGAVVRYGILHDLIVLGIARGEVA